MLFSDINKNDTFEQMRVQGSDINSATQHENNYVFKLEQTEISFEFNKKLQENILHFWNEVIGFH